MMYQLAGFRAPLLRRGVALLAIAAYFAAAVGCPAPSAAQPDPRAAYPCAGRGCGCRSAEECWRGCCCFTRAQRLAWAAARGMRLGGAPGEKTEEPATATLETKCGTSSVAGASGCPHCGGASRCAESCGKDSDRRVAACCGSDADHRIAASGCGHCQQHHSGRKSGIKERAVVGVEWLKCRGLGSQWLALGDAVGQPPAVVRLSYTEEAVGRTFESTGFWPTPAYVPPSRPG